LPALISGWRVEDIQDLIHRELTMELTKMINKKRIIAALAQLDGIKDEHKEWLAIRKEIGADIDPENVHVHCIYAQVLDPYGISPSFPTELFQVGREYFAQASNGEIWVSFDDLPKVTVSRLWQRMQAGDFDGAPHWADESGIAPNKMFWQPTTGPLAALPLAGRVAWRTTTQVHGPLIIKDADLGSFQLMIDGGHRRYRLAGWIDVATAKQFPSVTAHGSAVHIIEQRQLGHVDDMLKFVETGLGNDVDAMDQT
jgi:hypothetical protein